MDLARLPLRRTLPLKWSHNLKDENLCRLDEYRQRRPGHLLRCYPIVDGQSKEEVDYWRNAVITLYYLREMKTRSVRLKETEERRWIFSVGGHDGPEVREIFEKYRKIQKQLKGFNWST
jgi:hypothetical protein